MSKKNNGGPAFPYVMNAENYELQDLCSEGMTLKDYFAGQVIIGIIANAEGIVCAETMANSAYAIADSMIKEREKQGQESK